MLSQLVAGVHPPFGCMGVVMDGRVMTFHASPAVEHALHSMLWISEPIIRVRGERGLRASRACYVIG
jgi:hypothetical protein